MDEGYQALAVLRELRHPYLRQRSDRTEPLLRRRDFL